MDKIASLFVADIKKWYKMECIWVHLIALGILGLARDNPQAFQQFVATLPTDVQPHVPQIGYILWAAAVPFARLLDLGKQANAAAAASTPAAK